MQINPPQKRRLDPTLVISWGYRYGAHLVPRIRCKRLGSFPPQIVTRHQVLPWILLQGRMVALFAAVSAEQEVEAQPKMGLQNLNSLYI